MSLAYLTGIFPIGRYDTQSALNNFDDINMLTPEYDLTRYFGFTEGDVQKLCAENNLSFDDAKSWYDGYHIGNLEIYNPYSITRLIQRKTFKSYWLQTGSFDSILKAIHHNVDGIREIVLSLMGGNAYKDCYVSQYKNSIFEIKDKNTALVYLIHLGYLTYQILDDGTNKITIPNEEIRQEFINNNTSADTIFDGFEEYFEKSKKAANALLEQDVSKLEESFDYFHNQKISYKDYNNEIALRYVVKDALFALEKFYKPPFDEIPTGKGIADIAYEPKPQFAAHKPSIVIELKWNKSANTALEQIISKDYVSRFKGSGDGVLLVGVNCDAKNKKHSVEFKFKK